MKDKFLVKIPLNPDNLEEGYQELKFKTYKDVAEFLNTTTNAIKALIEGKLKCAYGQTKHLQYIKIELIDYRPVVNTLDDHKEYLRNLLEKSKQ
jgi:hypothetical protein